MARRALGTTAELVVGNGPSQQWRAGTSVTQPEAKPGARSVGSAQLDPDKLDSVVIHTLGPEGVCFIAINET